MKHYKITLLVLIFIGSSCSFNAKEKYLSDFTDFVAEVENNYTSYKSEDWKSIDEEFNYYSIAYFEEVKVEMSKEDMKYLGKLVARFSSIRAKGYGKQLKDGIENTKSFIEGVREGIIEKTFD
jgi:hypothetical protein